MLRCLFWNTGSRDVNESLGRLVALHSVDVVILAETIATHSEIVTQLSSATKRPFHVPPSPCQKLLIATSLMPHRIQPVYDDDSNRVTIRRLVLGKTDLLLTAVHLPSKLHWTDHEQAFEAARIAKELCSIEDSFGHRRSVVVGDFNMDPFEPGLVASHAFHALMTEHLASRESRVVNAQQYPCFYNPMWGFYGDRTAGPPGTYFKNRSTPIAYFWHIFDQVLVRSELVPALGQIQILTTENAQTPMDRFRFPGDDLQSDHFPLLFELNL